MCQRGNFAGRQMPPGSRRQAGQPDAADADADQTGDGVAESRHHAAHLPVAALIDGQLHFPLPRAVRVLLAAQQANILGGLCHAVVQQDAAPQTSERIFAGNARHGDSIRFRDMVTRMRHLEQEVAVVGQKDQAFAVGVEAANGTQHRLAADVYQIRHHLARVAVRVGARRDNPLRLVQRQVVTLQRRTHNPAVKQNFVRFGVYFRAKLGDDLPVNANPALGDPRFARPPRADPGGGEHFLKPFFHRVSFLLKSAQRHPPALRRL